MGHVVIPGGDGMAKKKKIPGPYKRLKRFNGAMGGVQLVHGALMLILGITVSNIKNFRLPLNVSFFTLDETLRVFISETTEIASFLMGPAARREPPGHPGCGILMKKSFGSKIISSHMSLQPPWQSPPSARGSAVCT